MRSSISFAAPLWPAFGALDWVVDRWIQPGFLAPALLLRAAFLPLVLFTLVRIRRSPMPSARAFRALELVAFGGGAACIGLMLPFYGGIASPYLLGTVVVVAARGVALTESWRKSLLPSAVVALAGPLAAVLFTALDPARSAELTNDAALAGFAQNVSFLLGVAAFTVIGGHVQWSLRRQVFESRSIGRYRLDRLLGRGGMGEVWAAWHHGLRRRVALKILRADPTRQDAVQRFEREVAAMGELSHPNTVRVFDYGTTEDGLWYYAMELLEGEDLGELLAREGPLPAGRALHFLRQASRALAEAHARGIVHRDLKPENLFVTSAGGEADFIKVLDFGIAKVHTEDATLTQEGWVGGTPAFMSPEAAAGRPTDARSDVYALGAVLFTALAGRPMFEDTNVARLLSAQIHERPPPLSALRSDVPSEVAALVERCLAKEPDARFADARALAAALERCAVSSPWVPGSATAIARRAAASHASSTAETIAAVTRAAG